MATKVAECVFLDTNVLVHAASLQAPLHEQALKAVQSRYEEGLELWVSRQVLREYLAVLTRTQSYAMPRSAAILAAEVRHLQSRFSIAEDGPAVTETLLDLVVRLGIGGKQVHDANIIATMLVYGVPTLLTDNVADFARYENLVRVVPLKS